ncbi:unnamed protein product, partial [Callosobruchus maculatus]
ISTALSCSF